MNIGRNTATKSCRNCARETGSGGEVKFGVRPELLPLPGRGLAANFAFRDQQLVEDDRACGTSSQPVNSIASRLRE
jgi:hypothetical protein